MKIWCEHIKWHPPEYIYVHSFGPIRSRGFWLFTESGVTTRAISKKWKFCPICGECRPSIKKKNKDKN